MKPVTIQKPNNKGRHIGQWVAAIQIGGVQHTLPVLHLDNFDGSDYVDTMKNDGVEPHRSTRFDEHKAALVNDAGLAIVQVTKRHEDGKKSSIGYAGVYEIKDLEFVENGYKLKRGRCVAVFAR